MAPALPLLRHEGPALAALERTPLPAQVPVRAGAFVFPEAGTAESRVAVSFRVEGEVFLPTALASMTAKYLRELAMRAFNEFADFYLQSSGQIYWSDTHQLSVYLDDYHERLDTALQAPVPGSEMITELYVPRESLVSFMDDVRRDFDERRSNVIYGTVRFMERDEESGLSYHGARYYAAWLGRWTSCDPSGINAGLNLFLYADGSPILLVDTTGSEPLCFNIPEEKRNMIY